MSSYIFTPTANTVGWMGPVHYDLVQRAVELKMPAVAITDRNSVAGASRLWHQCIKVGIKPIIGWRSQF
jgi:DNA polymerase III alpha subunit